MNDHFSAPQWVDYVRGQLSGAVAADMTRHLLEGCAPCAAVFGTWQGAAAFAEDERRLAPPAEALRAARSCFRRHRANVPAPSWNPLAALASATFATLAFDSGQLATAGVRNAGAGSRHLVFDAESLVVDVHVEPGARAGSLEVSGQVADPARPGERLHDVRLSLVDEHEGVDVVETSPFGEFHCTVDHPRAGFLVVDAAPNPIAIPLDTLLDPSTDAASHS